MDVQETLGEIMEQKLDRKQFLQRMGIAILAIFGPAKLFQARKSNQPSQTGGKGFGSAINLKDRR